MNMNGPLEDHMPGSDLIANLDPARAAERMVHLATSQELAMKVPLPEPAIRLIEHATLSVKHYEEHHRGGCANTDHLLKFLYDPSYEAEVLTGDPQADLVPMRAGIEPPVLDAPWLEEGSRRFFETEVLGEWSTSQHHTYIEAAAASVALARYHGIISAEDAG